MRRFSRLLSTSRPPHLCPARPALRRAADTHTNKTKNKNKNENENENENKNKNKESEPGPDRILARRRCGTPPKRT